MTLLPAVAVLAVSLLCCAAYAADNHVHGVAMLRVALDRNELTIEFESPLDNLVGFERAPRTEKERAAVRRMAEQLRQPEQLFVPSAEAKCTHSSVKLESPVIDPALLAVSAKPAPPSQVVVKGKSSHASITAEAVFRCDRPERLSALEVNAFDVFTGLKRVDVDVAGAKKQASAKLTPRARRVAW